MESNVPIRMLTLFEPDGSLVCDNIPQPLRDDIHDYVVFEGRLFAAQHRTDLDLRDGLQGYAYYEIPCLRAGRTILTPNTTIEGVSAEDIMSALAPDDSSLTN